MALKRRSVEIEIVYGLLMVCVIAIIFALVLAFFSSLEPSEVMLGGLLMVMMPIIMAVTGSLIWETIAAATALIFLLILVVYYLKGPFLRFAVLGIFFSWILWGVFVASTTQA